VATRRTKFPLVQAAGVLDFYLEETNDGRSTPFKGTIRNLKKNCLSVQNEALVVLPPPTFFVSISL
jgi:hypothetical protein